MDIFQSVPQGTRESLKSRQGPEEPFFFFFSVFTFLLGPQGRVPPSLLVEVFTVSSATPRLGPVGPGNGWAHGACSHNLGGALGGYRV